MFTVVVEATVVEVVDDVVVVVQAFDVKSPSNKFYNFRKRANFL